jgi:hypothetical protein
MIDVHAVEKYGQASWHFARIMKGGRGRRSLARRARRLRYWLGIAEHWMSRIETPRPKCTFTIVFDHRISGEGDF